MNACQFEASDTDKIWIVDPSNTSEKPVCKYHSYLQSTMENGITATIIFTLAAYASITLSGSSAILSIVIFFLSIVTAGLLMITLLMSLEFSVRYLFMDVPLLSVQRRVKKEKGTNDSHNCVNCEKDEDFEAVWKKYEKRLEFIGTPIKTYDEGINVYCESCQQETSEAEASEEESTNEQETSEESMKPKSKEKCSQ